MSGVAERLTHRGDDASESHEQQVAKQEQKTDTPLQINTLEQMTDWVRQLQTEASGPALQALQSQLQSKVDEATTHIAYYEKEIRERETEIEGLGMLQMGRKKKLREEIDTLRQQIQQAEIDQLNAQNRLHTVEVIVRPVVERVDAYRQRLYQTVEKFAYTF